MTAANALAVAPLAALYIGWVVRTARAEHRSLYRHARDHARAMRALARATRHTHVR